MSFIFFSVTLLFEVEKLRSPILCHTLLLEGETKLVLRFMVHSRKGWLANVVRSKRLQCFHCLYTNWRIFHVFKAAKKLLNQSLSSFLTFLDLDTSSAPHSWGTFGFKGCPTIIQSSARPVSWIFNVLEVSVQVWWWALCYLLYREVFFY